MVDGYTRLIRETYVAKAGRDFTLTSPDSVHSSRATAISQANPPLELVNIVQSDSLSS